MAALAQLNAEYLAAIQACRRDSRRIGLAEIQLIRQGKKLIYQDSPWKCSMTILSTIPSTAARVISAAALAIFFAPFALLCGKHSSSRAQFKAVIKSLKTESKLFAYGIYGVLIPSKGIDRICNTMVERLH